MATFHPAVPEASSLSEKGPLFLPQDSVVLQFPESLPLQRLWWSLCVTSLLSQERGQLGS